MCLLYPLYSPTRKRNVHFQNKPNIIIKNIRINQIKYTKPHEHFGLPTINSKINDD